MNPTTSPTQPLISGRPSGQPATPATSAPPPGVSLQGLGLGYRAGGKLILDGVDCHVPAGTVTGLLGRTRCPLAVLPRRTGRNRR